MVDFDSIKKKAQDLRGKAEDYVDDNRDKIDDKIDKAGDFVGKKTGRSSQVDNAVGKVKGFLDRNPATDGKPGDDTPGNGQTPPTQTPPPGN